MIHQVSDYIFVWVAVWSYSQCGFQWDIVFQINLSLRPRCIICFRM